MKNQKNGSTVLIVIMISAVILLYYTNAWRSIALMTDLSLKKYKYEKNFRAAEALYNYGLATCLNNFDTLVARKKDEKNFSIILYNGLWFPNDKAYNGILKLFIDNNSQITIESKIIDDQKNIFSVQALLKKETIKDPKTGKAIFSRIIINNWKVNGS